MPPRNPARRKRGWFDRLSVEDRGKAARRIHQFRLRRSFASQSRGIGEYNYELTTADWPRPPISRGLIQRNLRKMIQAKGSARILDVGCGIGRAMHDLRQKFGKKIYTVGLALRREDPQRESLVRIPYTKVDEAMDEFHVGTMERVRFQRRFDMITCVHAFNYALNAPLWLGKMYNLLSVRGKLFINFEKPRGRRRHPLREFRAFVPELKRVGAAIEYLYNREGKPISVIVTRNTNVHISIAEALEKPFDSFYTKKGLSPLVIQSRVGAG